jgi:hypothetical protein
MVAGGNAASERELVKQSKGLPRGREGNDNRRSGQWFRDRTYGFEGYTVQVYWNDMARGWLYRVYDATVIMRAQAKRVYSTQGEAERAAEQWVYDQRGQ